MKAVSIALLAGMLGCALVQPGRAAEAAKFHEKILWSFGSGKDGQYPSAGLIDVKGTLYGTTTGGGSAGCGGSGCGTVFSIDPDTGAEKVLYSFCSQQNCADGANPDGGLIAVNAVLYGTTQVGGANGSGTVYALDPKTGAEKVIYSFCALAHCTDGEYPSAGLVDVNGALYGTTEGGGSDDSGTVFVLDPDTGAETVRHSFCTLENCADGAYPAAALLAVSGTLYSTTPYGGGSTCEGSGCGTVFSLDTKTGAETVLHSFAGGADGQEPFAGLIDVNGTLYGTTFFGGQAGCSRDGCGTAFSVDPGTGAESVVYAFCQQQYCPDGALPYAGLLGEKGKLYGTTAYGGRTGCPQTGDCGTVFSVDPATGAEDVLYEFCNRKNCTDGWSPEASLIVVKGTLYGTTSEGGAHGHGTVFALGGKAMIR
jgi:uncharacterized repeat protein (TIGR03803 family)